MIRIQRFAALTAVMLFAALAASTAFAADRTSIDAAVRAALPKLHAAAPETETLAGKAAGVLIFPEVVKGGVIIGGQYGEGALLVGGATQGYYRSVAASFGLQLGGQTFGYAMFFMTPEALAYLDRSQGWDVGTAPTLVYGEEGWSGALNLSQTQEEILVVFFGQKGVMAGAGIQGAKISRFEPD